jgi:hypothetical protein
MVFLPDEDQAAQDAYRESQRPYPNPEIVWQDYLDYNYTLLQSDTPQAMDFFEGTWLAEPTYDAPDYQGLMNAEEYDFFLRFGVSPRHMSDELKQNIGGAARRQSPYANSYVGTDGFDYDQAAKDTFLLDFNRSWVANKGSIDLEWMLSHWDDLQAWGLGSDPIYDDLVQQLVAQGYYVSSAEMQEENDQAAFDQRVDRIVGLSMGTREQAMDWVNQWTAIPDEAAGFIAESYPDGIGFDQALDIIGPYAENAEFRAQYDEWFDMNTADGGAEKAEELGIDLSYETWVINRAHNKLVATERDRRFAMLDESVPRTPRSDHIVGGLLPGLPSFGIGDKGFFDEISLFHTKGDQPLSGFLAGDEWGAQADWMDDANFVFGALGNSIGTATGAIDWLALEGLQVVYGEDKGAAINQELGARFVRGLERLPGRTGDRYEDTDRAADELRVALGQAENTAVVDAGVDYITMFQEDLTDTPMYEEYMGMANGNEVMAAGFFASDMLFSSEGATAAQQEAFYQEQNMEYQLRQLEQNQYGLGQGLFDMIALYGEGVETGATFATFSVAQLFDGDPIEPWRVGELWRQSNEFDTPAEVLGLHGTFVGLGVDLFLTTLADPTTWIFGPRLARRGRAGVKNAKQIERVVNSKPATMVREQFVDNVRSLDSGAVAAQTLVDSMHQTKRGAAYMAAARGFKHPITSVRNYLKRWGAVTDDVAISRINRWMDPEASATDSAAVARAHQSIKTDGVRPATLTINPKTGAARVTDGADYIRAAREMGADAYPVRIKVDERFGVTTRKVRLSPGDGPVPLRANQASLIQDLADGLDVRKGDHPATTPGVSKSTDKLNKRHATEQGFVEGQQYAMPETYVSRQVGTHSTPSVRRAGPTTGSSTTTTPPARAPSLPSCGSVPRLAPGCPRTTPSSSTATGVVARSRPATATASGIC